ncbi:hypothetical protein M422DRAFT_152189, partial [Sphaerobolus stellatus SS14]
PSWTHEENVEKALEAQSRLNPDDIFGRIKPLKIEEIFKDSKISFRHRTSSANWEGTDKLTPAEEIEYAKKMGYLD